MTTTVAGRSYTAVACWAHSRQLMRDARALKDSPASRTLKNSRDSRYEVDCTVRAAKFWHRCALEARRNCWCNGTGVMLDEYESSTGYNVTVDCPDCTPKEN